MTDNKTTMDDKLMSLIRTVFSVGFSVGRRYDVAGKAETDLFNKELFNAVDSVRDHIKDNYRMINDADECEREILDSEMPCM